MEHAVSTQAVIFDRDGVLCFFNMHPLTEICLSLNIPVSSIRQTWLDMVAQSQEIDLVRFWQHIATKHASSAAQLEQLQLFDVDSCVQMYPDVEAAFQLLAHQQIKIGILSNFLVPTQIERSLAQVRSYINVVVAATEKGQRKPAYKPYQLILSLLQLHPQQCIFIDDQQINVQAALELGMRGILLDRATLSQSLDDFLATILRIEPQAVYDVIPVNTLCILQEP